LFALVPTLPVSLRERPNSLRKVGASSEEPHKSKKKTGVSLREIRAWKRKIGIFLPDSYERGKEIHEPKREIGISLEEIHNFFFPTTQLKAHLSHQKARKHNACGLFTLGNKDSNLESPDPETGALPFGHSPIRITTVTNARSVAKAPTGIEPVWTVLQTVA